MGGDDVETRLIESKAMGLGLASMATKISYGPADAMVALAYAIAYADSAISTIGADHGMDRKAILKLVDDAITDTRGN